jgi:phospholipase A2
MSAVLKHFRNDQEYKTHENTPHESLSTFQLLRAIIGTTHKVSHDIHDATLFPEVADVAMVRKGLDLCPEEKAFRLERKEHVRTHFAQYIGVDLAKIHPDDIPTIAFGSSGGGFRAMIATLGYGDEMKKAGLWDLLTYVGGVSGACWSLASYYTFGEADFPYLIDHCKRRLSPHHPLSTTAIRMLLSAPNGAYTTLGPLVEKQRSGVQTVPMDLYAIFTSGYIFLHHDLAKEPSTPRAGVQIAGDNNRWYKWSKGAKHLQGGKEPLPILTAVRHERPWKDWVDKSQPFQEPDHSTLEHQEVRDAWFQWFEMTPYEVGCDELMAWVPTWGFGRKFANGHSTSGLPEQSLSLLLGLCTSAPAGPLTAYLSTIKRNLPPGFIGDTIENIAKGISKLWGKQGTEEFEEHHPLHACNEHNFMFHLTEPPAGEAYPPGIENSPRIHLIDSGMDNNCPTYVFLHPARETDVIINLDASSDVQKDTYPERISQIGSRRGLAFTKRHDIEADPDTTNPDRFRGLYAQIYDGIYGPRPESVVDSYGRKVTNPPAPEVHQDCTAVYLPLLPNEKAVQGYDPSTAKFSGSYNLVWTPEQVQMLVDVSRANFREGQGVIKQALKEAWERKKKLRINGASNQAAV